MNKTAPKSTAIKAKKPTKRLTKRQTPNKQVTKPKLKVKPIIKTKVVKVIKEKTKTKEKNSKPKTSANVKSTTSRNFENLQYKIAKFHVPPARSFKRFKEAVYGKELKNSIDEIERGRNIPNDKGGVVQTRIEDMSDKTIQWVEKAEKLYTEYLKDDRNIKERDAHAKSVVKWAEMDSEIFKDNKNREYKKDSSLPQGKNNYNPGTFVLDRFEGMNEWERALSVIKRQNLKYSGDTGAILAIFLNELMTEWINDAINNRSHGKKTIQIGDFVRGESNNEDVDNLSDRFNRLEDERVDSLLPLITQLNTYHMARQGYYESKPFLESLESKNQEKNVDNTLKSNNSIRRKFEFKFYMDKICRAVKNTFQEKDGIQIKYAKHIKYFGSDVICEVIERFGPIIRSKMNFFASSRNKSKTVSTGVILDAITTVLLWYRINHERYINLINDRIVKYDTYCAKRKEKKAIRKKEELKTAEAAKINEQVDENTLVSEENNNEESSDDTSSDENSDEYDQSDLES